MLFARRVEHREVLSRVRSGSKNRTISPRPPSIARRFLRLQRKLALKLQETPRWPAAPRLDRPTLQPFVGQLMANAVDVIGADDQRHPDTHVENRVHFVRINFAKPLQPGKDGRNRPAVPLDGYRDALGAEFAPGFLANRRR